MDTLLQRHMSADGRAALRVMQWNVLADTLTYNFPRVPPGSLRWEYRFPLILEEIRRADADVVCLEEVDHFPELEASLSVSGYQGCYRKKEGWHEDGLALFVRSSTVALERWDSASFQGKRQVYLLAELRLVASSHRFMVAVTHLKSDAQSERSRVQQVHELLAALSLNSALPVLIAGDFNAVPSQAVYTLLQSSGFRSAYYGTVREGSEPLYTTLTYRAQERKEVIDYIWMKGWETAAVWSVPSEGEIGPGGLPGDRYPSDHISLVADLRLLCK